MTDNITPLQMIEKMGSIDISGSIIDNWEAYWPDYFADDEIDICGRGITLEAAIRSLYEKWKKIDD